MNPSRGDSIAARQSNADRQPIGGEKPTSQWVHTIMEQMPVVIAVGHRLFAWQMNALLNPNMIKRMADSRSADSALAYPHCWQNALTLIAHIWRDSSTEQAAILHQSACDTPPHIQLLDPGDAHEIRIEMRPVMLEIARRGSIAILLCHSHAGPYAHPSRIDIFETRRLLSLCRSIGVELVDHVILAQQDIFSFRQNGLL